MTGRIRTLRGVGLVTVLLTAVAGPVPARAAAQETPGQRACRAVLTDRGMGGQAGSRPCQTVAIMAVDSRTDALFDVLRDNEMPASELQSTLSLAPATGGSLAQGAAVPGVNPTSVAGATVAAVGSDGGADAIAAIAINPALFFIDPSARDQVARLTRFADVSFLVPVNGLDEDEDGDIDYFGSRVRINLNGLSSGSRLLEDAERVFAAIVGQDAQRAGRIRDALEDGSEAFATRCATALLAEGVSDAEAVEACGNAVDLSFDPSLHRQLAGELRKARELADSRYLGLDLRLDVGDPTLGEVAHASGTFLFAGIAAGRNFPYSEDGLAGAGLNARVGVRYATLSDTSATDFSIDGGLGFSWRRAMQSQHVTASLGLEFRYGGESEMEEELQTDFLMLRASLKVPVTNVNAVVINFGQPLAGEMSQVLSVSFDLGLLFGSQ